MFIVLFFIKSHSVTKIYFSSEQSFIILCFFTEFDAVFSEWLRRNGYGISRFNIRPEDFASVYVMGNGVFTGALEVRLKRPENPEKGPTDGRLFVRLPSGVVFYANLFYHPNITDDLGGRHRYYIVGQEDTFFSGALWAIKPSEPNDGLLTKDIPNNPKTFCMWGDLANFIGFIPRWAHRNRQ